MGIMTRLKDVNFEEFYFPPQDDIIKDFFIPALKNSDKYDRATGFFTSSSLIELSVGVCDLASRHGKIRIITSPRLYPEDVLAIKQGYDLIKTVGDSRLDGSLKVLQCLTDILFPDRSADITPDEDGRRLVYQHS